MARKRHDERLQLSSAGRVGQRHDHPHLRLRGGNQAGNRAVAREASGGRTSLARERPGGRPPLSAAYLIFAATYLVLAIGRLPGFRVDRTDAAIIGASLMLATNVVTVQEAYAAVNYETLMLLFGMMIVVANLRLSGFFTLVSAWVVEHAHRPLWLLAGIVAVAGVFSAFFVNDTMCLVLTPLVLEIAG